MLVFLVALSWALLQVRTDYAILSPGPALDISSMIRIKEVPAQPKSALLLTTVYSNLDATVAEWLQTRLNPGKQFLLVPRRDVIPPDMPVEEYNHLVVEMMEESKTVAKVVALTRVGYDVKATGQGARVQQLLPGNTVDGILVEGDVVVSAFEESIETATDLVNLVRRQRPGSTVPMRVDRNGVLLDTQVITRESDSEPGISIVGIMIRTHLFGHNLPVQIDIDSENIGGPSAGLMFALGIIDALDRDGVARGHRVAGTGTLSLDGTVGPVGGVAQKVIGAEQSGAEYFLAPKDNYEVARGAASRIRVVEVETVDDALEFLRGLKPISHAGVLPLPTPPAGAELVPAASG